MKRVQGITRSVLRIVAGLLFFCHGAAKLLGWFGGMPGSPHGGGLPPLLMAAGWIELLGGALLLLGLFTRAAAFITSGEMAVAYFTAHAPHGLWPIQNHGEPAVLNCFIFLYLAASGGGPVALDEWIRKLRPRRPAYR